MQVWGIVYLCSGHTTTSCQIDKQLHTFFFNKITIEELDGNYNLNVQPIQTIVAMKKILSVFCIATFLFASCSDEYDDSKLWQNVNDLKDRIAKLERNRTNDEFEIGSIQSIVDAVNERDYIVKIEELADKSGYSITFAKGIPSPSNTGKMVTMEKMHPSSESIFTKVSIIGRLRPMTKQRGYWIMTGIN